MQPRFFLLGSFALLFLCIVGAFVGITPTSAAMAFTVNSTADAIDANLGNGVCATAIDECTFRAAIMEANALPGDDIITLPAGIYTLTIAGRGEDVAATGDLDITSNLTVNGVDAANTIVDAGELDRIFHILGSSTVNISAVTLRGGSAFMEPSAPDNNGGGILNSAGDLTLTNSTLSSNTAGGTGAGLFNSTGGALTLTNSSVFSNSAPYDGSSVFNGADSTASIIDSTINGNNYGIANLGMLTIANSIIRNNFGYFGGIVNGGTMTITASTIHSNIAGAFGGGIFNDGTLLLVNSAVISNTATSGNGIRSTGTLTITNTTISSNSGDGLHNDGTANLSNVTLTNNTGTGIVSSGAVNIRNTIIARNTSGQGADCSGTLNSLGYNLIKTTTGCNIGGDTTGNLMGVDPLLGPLQDNGGPTFMRALLSGSPAINAGDPVGCADQLGVLLLTDQRGWPRAGRCDIGAYEKSFATKQVSGSFKPGSIVTYTLALSNQNGMTAVTEVAVTDTLPISLTYVLGSFTSTTGIGGESGGVITWTGAILTDTETLLMFAVIISPSAPLGIVITNAAQIQWKGITISESAQFDTSIHLYLPLVTRNISGSNMATEASPLGESD